MTLSADDPRHGKYSSYTNHKCRCGRCRTAWADHHREWTHRTARAVPRADYLDVLQQNKLHGTEGAYKRCKCDRCRHAATIARWERRQNGGDVKTHKKQAP